MPVGIDNYEPFQLKSTDRWTTYALTEVYLGRSGKNKYIMRVNDHAIDHITDTTYKCVHVDPLSYMPELKRVVPLTEEETTSGPDFGCTRDSVDTFRIYLNTSTTPHELSVDGRYTIGGSLHHHAIIYSRAGLGEEPMPISSQYDQSGVFKSHEIPLEYIGTEIYRDHVIKNIPTCHTEESDLENGEVVTAVIYSKDGKVVTSRRDFIIERTEFMPTLNTSLKRVVSIGISSPFLSASQDRTLIKPTNVDFDDMALLGVVEYNNGDMVKLPIDNTRFSIFGRPSFNVPKSSLVLSYDLGENETAAGTVRSRSLTKTYTLLNSDVDGTYNLKLNVFPIWSHIHRSYRLKAWLTNYDREMFYDVTELMTVHTVPFDDSLMGQVQDLEVSVSLNEITAAFRKYIHVETIRISLMSNPSASETPFLVHGATANFGSNLWVQRDSQYPNIVDVNRNRQNTVDWLQSYYLDAAPLVNYSTEQPLIPTHYIVWSENALEITRTISDLSPISMTRDMLSGDSLYFKFIRRLSDTDLIVGVSSLIIR